MARAFLHSQAQPSKPLRMMWTGIDSARSNPQLVLTQIASDNFNRANGAISGANNWLATSEGSAVIASNELESGTLNTARGNYRTNETYNSNQYSQATVGSVALASGDYIGVSIRNQDNANNYTGIYFNNVGSFFLILYKKVAGTYTQLVQFNLSGALPQGTTFTLAGEGSVLSLRYSGGGAVVIDSTFPSGGTPGVEMFWGASGAGTMDNWAGGNAATGALPAALVTDNFNRANGGVSSGQPNWQVMAYSAGNTTPFATTDAQIVSNQVVDTQAAGTQHNGSTRTDSFNSDHWSTIQQGTTAETAGGFAFATARMQNGGNAGYIGGSFHNNSAQIYRLDGGGVAGGGTSTLLAGVATPGNDPAGTTYALVANGSRISLMLNNAEILAVTDATYTGGTPGIMAYGTASLDNFTAGNV